MFTVPDLPVMLKVAGQRVVIFGGGEVAARRAAALVEAGADVTVIAPAVEEQIEQLGVPFTRRAYRQGDLKGARLAVAATDDPAVNEAIAAEAAELGVLINRTDEPTEGDVIIPAHRRIGPVTLAVSTGGISPRAAADICDDLRGALDHEWVTLLSLAEPFRSEIKKRATDKLVRKATLRRLIDEQAHRVLRDGGEDALAEHYRGILQDLGKQP